MICFMIDDVNFMYFFPLINIIHNDILGYRQAGRPFVISFIQQFLPYIFVSLFIKSFLFMWRKCDEKRKFTTKRNRFCFCFKAECKYYVRRKTLEFMSRRSTIFFIVFSFTLYIGQVIGHYHYKNKHHL